jgi:hypothetical protein
VALVSSPLLSGRHRFCRVRSYTHINPLVLVQMLPRASKPHTYWCSLYSALCLFPPSSCGRPASRSQSCRWTYGATGSSAWYVSGTADITPCPFAHILQIMAVLVPGFLVFPPMTFFIALYLQELFRYSALQTAVHMLPMAVSGIIVNVRSQATNNNDRRERLIEDTNHTIQVVAGLILHLVSNKILMGIGTFAYTVASILVAVQRTGDSYWAFTFPALIVIVVGADFHFNVANVSPLPPFSHQPTNSNL